MAAVQRPRVSVKTASVALHVSRLTRGLLTELRSDAAERVAA
jgi:hypothetical protein